jgi:hypothetical protein
MFRNQRLGIGWSDSATADADHHMNPKGDRYLFGGVVNAGEEAINHLEELASDAIHLRAMCLMLSAALARSEALLGEARARVAELEVTSQARSEGSAKG